MTDFEPMPGAARAVFCLAALCAACAGDAVKLGSDLPRSETTYELLKPAAQMTVRFTEPPTVQPSVVHRPGSGTIVTGGYSHLLRLPSDRILLALVGTGAIDASSGGSMQLEILDREGNTLATAMRDFQTQRPGLMYGLTVLAGYGEGPWVLSAVGATYDLAHFDDALHVVSTSSAAGADAAALIDEFLEGTGMLALAYPVQGLQAAAAGSACRQLSEEPQTGARIRSRVWHDGTLWLAGCSNPPDAAPDALSKPALYQCSETGGLQHAFVLDLLSTQARCFTAIDWYEGRIVGLLSSDPPAIAWVDVQQGTFDLLQLQKDAPPIGQASRNIATGAVVLDPASLSMYKLALAADGAVLVSVRQGSDSEASILCMALAPPVGSVRCIRLGATFDDVFASPVLTDSHRAFVLGAHELWGVDFDGAAP